MSEDPGLKTVYLFGAGASLPAGLPGIDDMTKKFFDTIIYSADTNLTNSLKSHIKRLEKITREEFTQPDLESVLSLIIDLEDDRYKKIIEHNYPEITEINREVLKNIKIAIHSYIRETLESIKPDAVEYLSPLLGIAMESGSINIFTLNYDGTIELLCEKYHIEYSDGFNQYWDPTRFENPATIVKIFKLHGSLYWLRSESRRVIRVPLKGLEMDKVKYYSDDAVSEMMIYPALQKEKYSEIYSWLSQKFILTLNIARNCVIIGYSFRDKDLRENIVDALHRNSNLWLIIISPNASIRKMEYFTNIEMSSRVIVMNMGVEEVITTRKLTSTLAILDDVRQREENTWISQLQSERRLSDDWLRTLIDYKKINHQDRIKYIVEKLSVFEFPIIDGKIEYITGEESLCYLTGYYKNKDSKGCAIWKKIFTSYCSIVEYAFFCNSQELKAINPITQDYLKDLYFEAIKIDRFSWKLLKDNAESLVSIASNDELKLNIEKFEETIEVLDNATDANGKVTMANTRDVKDKYEAQHLGLARWASKMSELIDKF